MSEQESLLSVSGVGKRFGGIHAVSDVSFTVREGETVGVIGPNGAGKSTLLELLAGAQRSDGGSIRFRGREIVDCPAHVVSRLGIARTFQKLRPFLGMTALENVMVGALVRDRDRGRAREHAEECIEFVGLGAKRDAIADTLSTGQRKRLEFARAIACRPTVYLLDEVMAGIDHRSLGDLVSLVARLRDDGATIVMIEHNLPVLGELCDRLVAMHLGRKIADGRPAEVLRQAEVVESYVGSSGDA
ncbi:MAG: ABC transporter ATP-binding protein [Solirubrobacteraceae bacterium]